MCVCVCLYMVCVYIFLYIFLIIFISCLLINMPNKTHANGLCGSLQVWGMVCLICTHTHTQIHILTHTHTCTHTHAVRILKKPARDREREREAHKKILLADDKRHQRLMYANNTLSTHTQRETHIHPGTHTLRHTHIK